MKIYRLSGGKLEKCDFVESEIVYRLFSGIGLFETMKIIDGCPIFLEDHIQRMNSTFERIWGKRIDEEVLAKGALEASEGESGIAVLKLVAVVDEDANAHIFFVVDKYPYSKTDELKIKIVNFERNPRGFSAGLKPVSYFENVVLREKVNREGFDEAIFTSGGFVAEGTRTNIFWIKDNKVFTPPLSLGILSGITRKNVISLCKDLGIPVFEERITPDELLEADAVFLTSSLLGVAPVSLVVWKDRKRGFEKNPLCYFLKDKFSELERSFTEVRKLSYQKAR